ncbi:MAG: TIR domain-containing protein [Anaerolineaceae bacterium]|nr:TIR domain-containing protein [Anaerolineaceae bacterium]
MQVEKTVFISYRRTNAMTARAVYQHLTAHGYDCFLDFESIDSGSFERIILNQILAKAHFVVILTPSALERCTEPGDWLRREIEYALDNGRNIVPLMFDGFSYRDVQKYLTGKLDVLPQYNALEIPSAYFEEAMARLENRFLNKSLDVILRPTPNADKQAVAEAKAEVEQQPTVTKKRLSAEEWFECGNNRAADDYDGQIADYTEAIRLNPQYAIAYKNRATALNKKGDIEGAIADANEAIRINSKLADAYNELAIAHNSKGHYYSALADSNIAIRINPKLADAYINRGVTLYNQQEYKSAIADFEAALRIDPNYANAKEWLEVARKAKANQRK